MQYEGKSYWSSSSFYITAQPQYKDENTDALTLGYFPSSMNTKRPVQENTSLKFKRIGK